ncbi:MAG TPA: c-type cytochrome [bacterium]|nr:c-type cytochrome [bacterium]
MRRRRPAAAAAALVVMAVVVIAARSRAQTPASTPPSSVSAPASPLSTDQRRGADLYALHCASCHGVTGQGTADGIPLRGIGAAAVNFALSTGRMPLADPHQPMVRRLTTWTRPQIDAVVAFVTSLAPGGPPIPAVHPEGGDLARGEQLFAANCAPCHGTAGQGAAVGEGADAPDLYDASALEIAEAVRIGPNPMPRFDAGVIDQHELDSLVRYAVSLRAPADPGGLSLGHLGPVAEGFIAWLVGFGGLVVIIRLIGTTT